MPRSIISIRAARWLAPLAAVLALALTAPGGIAVAGEDYISEATQLTAQKDWTALEALARRWIATLPLTGDGYYELGVALDGQGKPADAIAAYRRACELGAFDGGTEPWHNLFIDLNAAGRRQEMIAGYADLRTTQPLIAKDLISFWRGYLRDPSAAKARMPDVRAMAPTAQKRAATWSSDAKLVMLVVDVNLAPAVEFHFVSPKSKDHLVVEGKRSQVRTGAIVLPTIPVRTLTPIALPERFAPPPEIDPRDPSSADMAILAVVAPGNESFGTTGQGARPVWIVERPEPARSDVPGPFLPAFGFRVFDGVSGAELNSAAFFPRLP